MADTPFLEQWSQQVRTHPQLRRFHVPGVMRSYPVLAVQGEQTHTRFFYYPGDQIDLDALHLEAPRLCIVLNLADGTLIEAKKPEEFGIEPFEPTVYRVTDERLPAIQAALERLPPLYDVLVARFPAEAAGLEGRAFWETLETIVPPPLLPAYHALGAEFVAWCTAE